MKTKIHTTLSVLFVLALLPHSANAESQTGLTDQMNELKIPENTAPAGVSKDKLYSAQSRYIDLTKKFEFDLGGSKNLTSDSFLNMTGVDLTVRYHFNNRWSVAASGSYGFNEFTESANRLIQHDGILPNAAIVKWRTDLLAGYNLFYGKFRINMDQVFYFDQYVAVGPGMINTQYGTSPSAVADVGFALWFGSNWSARFGAKSDFFNEKKRDTSGTAYHLLAHLDVGYLIGGGESTHE